ncbi:cation:proton antiporter [Candidatus Woesearchaeota archaeon]|nr:cation:proton antiporter [Candidatus Woesearchaeota archaeon]
MGLVTLFSIAAIVIFIGFLGEWIFDKTNIPDVIWLMILGIFLGQFVNISGNEVFQQISPIFTTFALIFILFEGALNIDLRKLISGIIGGSSLSFLNFLLSLMIVPLVMLLLGWGFGEGLLLGAIIGGASSAVIIPLTKRLNIHSSTALVLTFESAISDVLCIVGALTIVNMLTLNSLNLGTIVQEIVISFGLATFVGIVGGLTWFKVQKVMDRFSKSYMTTIAALMLLYGFVEFLGSNGAIACLSFGIIVGNSKKIFSFLENQKEHGMTPSAKFFYSEISFFVKTFFFVYIGLIIDLSNIGLIILGLLLTILLFLTRPWAVSISNRKKRIDDKDRVFMEILTPKGLAAAVLAQLPMQYVTDYPDKFSHASQFSTIVLAVIFFSILISTLGVFLTEKGKFKGVKKMLDLRRFKRKDRD